MFSNMSSGFAQFYLNRNDLNKDGQVTKFELTKQTKKEFVNLDTNSDGVLSRTEFKK